MNNMIKIITLVIRKLKCLFGFHEWIFFETPFGIRWHCKHCDKWKEIDENE